MKQFCKQFFAKQRARVQLCALLLAGVLVGAAALGAPARQGVYTAALARPLAGRTVALDPGHGGYDGGARCRDSGKWEKELNLAVALKTEQALQALGARVVLTRREDISLHTTATAALSRKRQDLAARKALCEQAGADVLVSIHMNEYRSRSESGPQAFYERGADAGRLLAGAMQEALVAGLSPRRVRQAAPGDYSILRGVLPSVLVECGFVSNAEEEKRLLTEEYQRRLAQAIADGVCRYFALPVQQ